MRSTSLFATAVPEKLGIKFVLALPSTGASTLGAARMHWPSPLQLAPGSQSLSVRQRTQVLVVVAHKGVAALQSLLLEQTALVSKSMGALAGLSTSVLPKPMLALAATAWLPAVRGVLGL